MRSEPLESSIGGWAGERLTAVLIDDTSEIRMLLRAALEDVGIEVVGEAADGASGVEIAASCRPAIVILDVSMPVLDGLTALPQIRAALPGARIIMLSALDRELCAAPALERGADAYVEKGQLDQLMDAVLGPPRARGQVGPPLPR